MPTKRESLRLAQGLADVHQAGADSIAPNDGRFFARDGVILVAMNYRLGALGFFAHPALTKEAGLEPLAN